MIVVDTNIIVYLWLPCEYTQMAEKLLNKDSHWVSSTLWKSEFRNVVSSFYRRKLITYERALEVILNAEEQLINSEYSVSSLQVMEKAKTSQCTAYDCEYVALAEVLNCNLVTNDRKILKSFPSIATNLKCIVSIV